MSSLVENKRMSDKSREFKRNSYIRNLPVHWPQKDSRLLATAIIHSDRTKTLKTKTIKKTTPKNNSKSFQLLLSSHTASPTNRQTFFFFLLLLNFSFFYFSSSSSFFHLFSYYLSIYKEESKVLQYLATG